MDQQAVKQVKRLLGGQDASDVAGWGHQVDDTYPGMSRLHFQVHDDVAQPFCGPAEARIAKCEDNICLLTAIKHFYGKVLADEGRKIDYPHIDYSKVSKGVKFTDADSVKMLINLIGDLHQPMHVGFAGDDNGRKVEVIFRGRTMSLYDVWDKGISEAVRNEESGFWLGGWTHVRAVGEEFQRDKELWKQEGAFKTFEKWAEESVAFACSQAYTHPGTGKRLAGPGAEVGQKAVIDETAYEAWKEQWLRQILIAGERTAIVLNDILDSGGAGKLHEGTAVKTHADEAKERVMKEIAKEREEVMKADRSSRSSSSTYVPWNLNAFLTNLGIAIVVVPLFLVVANYGPDPRTWVETARALLEPDSGGGASGGGGRNVKRTE